MKHRDTWTLIPTRTLAALTAVAFTQLLRNAVPDAWLDLRAVVTVASVAAALWLVFTLIREPDLPTRQQATRKDH